MKFLPGTIRVINSLFCLLPFRIVYIKASFTAWLLYSVIRYRRKVVDENLMKSFPGLSLQERNRIAKRFYLNLADVIGEIFKTQALSASELIKRVKVINPQLVEEYRLQGRSVIFVSGHCGNWEWYAASAILQCPGFDHSGAIVKPLSSEVFEDFMSSLRTRFVKNPLIPFKSAYKVMASRRHELSQTYILADQTPHQSEINYHTRFLNQETAIFLGTERITKSLDQVVIFSHIRRVKRGFYEIEFELITDKPKLTAEFEITSKHVSMLEKDIIAHPELWLWSHRRWKYKIED